MFLLQQKEDKAKATEGVPDEEGWITVTKKGRRPGGERSEAMNSRLMEKEKKKRAQKELLNFYAWQHRNRKKERKWFIFPMLLYNFLNERVDIAHSATIGQELESELLQRGLDTIPIEMPHPRSGIEGTT